MRLLIIDDSTDFLNTAKQILTTEGFKDIVVKKQALEAIVYLLQEKEAKNVNLILLGLAPNQEETTETVTKIKEIDALKDTPVLMAVLPDQLESIKPALEAGAIDFVYKPLNKAELSIRVKTALRIKEMRASCEAQGRELEDLRNKFLQNRDQLNRLSVTDGLTGISNRAYFDEVLKKEWQRSIREKRPLSMLMVGIDCYKEYEDHYGTLKADDCLKQVVSALSGSIKRSGDLLARMAEDKFAALLPTTDKEGALLVTNAIYKSIAELDIEHSDSPEKAVTISIGLATSFPILYQEPSSLIEIADKALYKARSDGGNKLVTI